MIEWPTIDAAPKDGTWVVGAEWQKPEGYPPELQTSQTRFVRGAWRYVSGCDWTPSHWMPLPPNG